MCLHTSIFIETPSLEGLPSKAKEDPSPHEMRLSPTGHQPNKAVAAESSNVFRVFLT